MIHPRGPLFGSIHAFFLALIADFAASTDIGELISNL
jgi:hypothetical protein